MKKQFLFLVCFNLWWTVEAQVPVTQHRAGLLDQQALKFRELQPLHSNFSKTKLRSDLPDVQAQKPGQPVTNVSWNLLSGSMNVEGMLSSSSHPLQYIPGLNMVSFIHQKSDTYTTTSVLSSSAQSGIVVAELSTNWGFSWDSTAIWANNTDWGRFPQGAVYNPPANTNTTNAFIVASGVTNGGNGMTGNFYASKSLNGFNTTPSSATGAQQFYSFGLSSYPAGQAAHSWSRSGFTYTDDGVMRSAGIVQGNYTNLKSIRGFAVATGTFNGTSFDWHVDTLIPNCMTNSLNEKHLLPDPRLAFNQAGTVGYLVGLGVLANSDHSNKGYQPIIYKMDKTLNANATWTLMPSLNFNSPGFKPLVQSSCQGKVGLAEVYINGSDTMGVPFVEDYDIVVDKDNKLHIAATIMSTASNHPDSLQFAAQFTTSINPTEKYRWRHAPGSKPYLYDFLGNGLSSWTAFTIDSISSESPGTLPGEAGYYDNFWDSAGASGFKPPINSRIQLGRTPDGSYILYSWTESDSAITNYQYKWNSFPNIKVRVLSINIGSSSQQYLLNTGFEQDISHGDPDVFTRSTLHYMSPVCSNATVSASFPGTKLVDFRMPFTTTNSNPYSQNTNNSTWYGDAKLSFTFATNMGCGGPNDFDPLTVGVKEDIMDFGFVLHPNPANDELTLSFGVDRETNMEIQIINGLGQTVDVLSQEIRSGSNSIKINLKELPTGLYFLSVEREGVRSTKKFLKE